YPIHRRKPLSLPARWKRRSPCDAERHFADRILMRCSQRASETRRHGRYRGCRTSRASRPADGTVLFTSDNIMIDLDDKRLAVAKTLGATTGINSTDGHAADHVMKVTEGAGVDVAIEAVGVPATLDICQAIVAPGGRIANVGVHGKPVELHLEKLWDRNISLTTRLVDTAT